MALVEDGGEGAGEEEALGVFLEVFREGAVGLGKLGVVREGEKG